MADYDFYVNEYLGSSIQEKAFPSLAAQAAGILEGYERRYQVSCPGPASRDMAICAMAECLHARNSRSSASVGSVTVHYQKPEPLGRLLYRAATTYLDIYRGVK